jgi:hypothetical protein
VVRWNGFDRATTYVSSTQLTAGITAADIQNAGTATVKVFNPGGGGESNGLTFTITQPNTAPVAGLAGSALGFDGTDDVVNIPHNAIQNAFPLTVSCWIKTGQSNSTRVGVINLPDGQPTLLPSRMTQRPADLVAREFGDAFAVALVQAPVGEWMGPIDSSFGLHYVHVSERTPAVNPVLAAVRDQVVREWENDRRLRARTDAYAKMRGDYDVSVEATLPTERR